MIHIERFYSGTVEDVTRVKKEERVDDFIKLDNSDFYFGMCVVVNKYLEIFSINRKRVREGNYVKLEIHCLLDSNFFNEVIHFDETYMRGAGSYDSELNTKMLEKCFFEGHAGGWIKKMEVYKDSTEEKILFRYGSRATNPDKEKTKKSVKKKTKTSA